METESPKECRALGRGHLQRQGPGSDPSWGGLRHSAPSRPPRLWLLPSLLSPGPLVSPSPGLPCWVQIAELEGPTLGSRLRLHSLLPEEEQWACVRKQSALKCQR